MGRETEWGVPNSERAFSRREFLRRAPGFLGIAAGISRFWETEAGRVLAQEVKEGENWAQGLRQLHERAIHGREEAAGFFVVDNAGTGSWKNFETGSELKVTSNYAYVSKLAELLVSLAARESRKVINVHTHNIAGLEAAKFIDHETAERLRLNPDALMPTVPPSLGMKPSQVEGSDFGFSLWIGKVLKDSPGLDYEESVVDPRGVWFYSLNFSHSFVQKKLQLMQGVGKFNVDISKDPANATRLEQLTKHTPLEASLGSLMYDKSLKLSSAQREELKSLLRESLILQLRYEEQMAALTRERRRFIVNSMQQQTVNSDEIVEKYGALGVKLRFLPISEAEGLFK